MSPLHFMLYRGKWISFGTVYLVLFTVYRKYTVCRGHKVYKYGTKNRHSVFVLLLFSIFDGMSLLVVTFLFTCLESSFLASSSSTLNKSSNKPLLTSTPAKTDLGSFSLLETPALLSKSTSSR